jgi:hypothetical protein
MRSDIKHTDDFTLALFDCKKFIYHHHPESSPINSNTVNKSSSSMVADKLISFIGMCSNDILPEHDVALQDFISSIMRSGKCCIILSSQLNTAKLNELYNRKRLYRKGGLMSVTTWGEDLEGQLKKEQKANNIAKCLILGNHTSK